MSELGEKKEKKDKHDKHDKKHKKEKKDKKDSSSRVEERKRPREAEGAELDPYDSDVEAEKVRATRKAAKQAEKIAKVLGYTNDANPFGDSNLLKPFVWGKKKEQDLLLGKAADTSESSAQRRVSTMSEIEAVRARRLQREEEQTETNRLRIEERRLREMAQNGDWAMQEETFHLKQTKLRSQVRIAAGRETPLDTIAKNILIIEAAASAAAGAGAGAHVALTSSETGAEAALLAGAAHANLRDPVEVVRSLPASELPAVLEGVSEYIALEHRRNSLTGGNTTTSASTSTSAASANYAIFWEALLQVARAAHLEYERKEKGSGTSIHSGVITDVRSLLAGKDIAGLKKLHEEISHGIQGGTRKDVPYWQAMADQVELEIAAMTVRNVHRDLLSKQRAALAAANSIKREEKESSTSTSSSSSSSGRDGHAKTESTDAFTGEQDGDRLETMDDAAAAAMVAETPTGTAIKYSWSDRFRPRKPRYLNKVRTGWDWNKYNQTHYDHDNPPPRTVQGYQFTIFYPDMLDKSATPTYHVEAAGSPELAILRFHAPGGPYEDVAFQILNKEWDTNRKAGFRVTFERGVMSLSFNYKRVFYRR